MSLRDDVEAAVEELAEDSADYEEAKSNIHHAVNDVVSRYQGEDPDDIKELCLTALKEYYS